MATAPPSPNDLTRQQLDELDALLQRMLSLPLAPPEPQRPAPTPPPAAPPLPPIWRHDPQPAPAHTPPPAPEPPSSVSLLAEAMKQQSAPAIPQAAKPAPPQAAKPEAAKPAPPQATSAAPQVAKAAPPPIQRPAPPRAAKPEAAPPAPQEPPVPVLFLPFVLLNALFDAVCGLFGPPGKALRSPPMKHLYGLVGIGLLLYTAARVAQVQAWVSLPVTLPWPK